MEVITAWLDSDHCPNCRLLREGPPGDLGQQPWLCLGKTDLPGQGEQLNQHLQHMCQTGGQQRLQLTGTVQCRLWLCQPPSNPYSWSATVIELILSSELWHFYSLKKIIIDCSLVPFIILLTHLMLQLDVLPHLGKGIMTAFQIPGLICRPLAAQFSLLVPSQHSNNLNVFAFGDINFSTQLLQQMQHHQPWKLAHQAGRLLEQAPRSTFHPQQPKRMKGKHFSCTQELMAVISN